MTLIWLLAALLSAPAFLCFPTHVQSVPPECIDPTYACQDLESARSCGVVKSCIHDVWATMSVPDDNDDICSLCKEMVKEARDQLLSNMTQEEIKEVFEGSCKLLPIKLIANGCIKIVDELIPEIVEMLASRMDPTMVCTVSGLCNLVHLPIENKLHKLFRSAFVSTKDNRCDECTSIVTDAKNFVSSNTEADLKEMALKFCKVEVKSIVCEVFVHTYFNQVYTYLIAVDPKAACAAADICPSFGIKCIPNKNIEMKDDLTCEFCTNVLEHIREIVIANTTEEEFKTALLNFCKHVGSFSDRCTKLVTDYYDMLFDYIRKMNTKGVCTFIGLCNNESCSNIITPLIKIVPAVEVRKSRPMVKLVPALTISKNIKDYVHPLIKIIPRMELSKKHQKNTQDTESNDIFDEIPKSNQLPVARFSHPLITFERDTECAFCKAISFYLKTDLNGDRSKTGVKKALNKVCEKWVKEYPDHCKSFVEKYFAQIQLKIVENSDFDDICFGVKACPLQDENKGLNVRVLPHQYNNTICDLCKEAFDEIESQLKNPSTKQNVEALLDQFCNVLPQSLQAECRDFIQQNVNVLFNVLEQELVGDNICPALRLCPSSLQIHLPEHVKDIECDMCKELVQQLQQQLKDPSVKQAVTDLLEKGCSMLPQELAAECKTFVDGNVDNLINILVQDLDPTLVCSALKLCSAPQRKFSKVKENDLECELCKEVVTELQQQLSDNATEEEIKAALDKVCSYLPSSLTAKCETFVNTYTDLLISILAQELDPAMVCAALKICPASSRKVSVVKKENDLECELCKEIVTELQKQLSDHATEEEIKAALDKVCSYLPSSFTEKCKNFVDTYTDLLISILSQELDPTMVCAALNVCPAKDLECEGCQYIFHFLQNQLMENGTQEKVKALLKKMCAVLPDTYSDNCEAFVDQYGDSLLVLIAQEIDPSILCTQLGVCTSIKKVQNKLAAPVSIKSLNLDECSMCTTVVDYLDKLLEQDDIDKEITAVVEKVCSVVPSSVKSKCETVVETYGPYILQMIGQLADSKQVCQEIDMCPSSLGQVHLVGGNKCTFGPSYWCQSTVHASACKAEMYCTQKVWKK